MRTKLIAGNCKMHGGKPAVRSLVGGILARLDPDLSAEVLILPPFPYLPLVASLTESTPVMLGAQNLSEHAAEIGRASCRDRVDSHVVIVSASHGSVGAY